MGPREIMIIAIVVVLLFGAPKLPQLARAIGKSMRILKDETKSLTDDDKPAEASTNDQAPQSSTQSGADDKSIPDSTVDTSSIDNERRDQR